MSVSMVAAEMEMSALMVDSNGNKCVDGFQQRLMRMLMVDGDG
jgi:hypothetical protein